MEQPENSQRNKKGKKIANRAYFIRMMLILFLLVIVALTILDYGICRYKQDYYQNALRACDVLGADLSEHSGGMPGEDVLQKYVPESLNQVADELHVYIYLFDEQGTCVVTTDTTGQKPGDVALNNEMLSDLKEKGTYLNDQSNGKFNLKIAEPLMCRGITVPLTIDGVTRTYYMFSCSTTRPVDAFTRDMIFVTMALLVGMVVISSVFAWYSTRLRSRRQESLLRVLRSYAQGDFSQQLNSAQYFGTELEEIAQLTQEISSQTQRAEESSRQFVSNVSHELRTPMTIIKGFVEGILDGTVPKNKRMEYLSIVSQEIQRLQMLVTSMLNLTKFDAGTIQLNYRMFTLNDTAFRTVLMFSSRLEKRHIEIEGLDSEPVRAYADPDLIGQVVYNLVENAVKFVNDGGKITFIFREEEDVWVFAVRNTGNGISKEELPKIFERFYKSDASRSQDKTGLGLGLDISRRIIHLHQAQISVRSEEHAYTEFEVRLPRIEPPEQDMK